MNANEIEVQLDEIDWDGVFQDAAPRPERSQRRKTDDQLYLVKGKAGVSDQGVKLPSAAVQGQKFNLILKALTLSVSKVKDFTHLPIPFRAVAMDIATGDEVVIGNGDLALAIRASMAIPAAFSAVEMDGRLLVDGGAANNLPISVVRQMGADIVIAIDISTPLQGRDELNNPLAMLGQLTGLLTRRNVEEQVKTLKDGDVLIIPELGEISTMSFDKVLDAVEVGRIAGLAQKHELAPLAPSQAITTARSEQTWKPPIIDFIRFENDSRLNDKVLSEHLGIEAGEKLDLARLEKGIGRIHGLDIFESVRYDLIEENGQNGIAIYAKKKSWGVDSLQLGMELSSDFGGQSSFNIGGAFTKQPLNSLNGEFRAALQIGEEPLIAAEIYQPLDPAARYFAHGIASWRNQNVRLFTGSDSRADSEFEINRLGIELGLGRNFGNWGELRIGLRRSMGDADLDVGVPPAAGFDFDDGQFFTRFRVDTLDSLDFPRSGFLGQLEWNAARSGLGSDAGFDQIRTRLGGAKSWGDHTFIGNIRFDTTLDDDAPLQNRFRLGGFLQLSGLEPNELSGQHLGIMSLAYQRLLHHSKLFPVYAGGALQMGNTWDTSSAIGIDNAVTSGTLFLGADTPIGPVYLGLGVSEGGRGAAYLFLGQPFF